MGFIKKILGRIRILIYIGEECQLLKDMKEAFYKEKKFSEALFCRCKKICHDEPELDKLEHAKAILEQQNAFSQSNSKVSNTLLSIMSLIVAIIAIIIAIYCGSLTVVSNSSGEETGKIILTMYAVIPILIFLVGLAFILFFSQIFSTYDRRMVSYFYSIICNEIEERKVASCIETNIKVKTAKKRRVKLNVKTNLYDV